MDKALTINDILTLYEWAIAPESSNFKAMRRTAIKSTHFPVVIDKRGNSPQGLDYLMRIKVLGKKIEGNAVECCIVTPSANSVNPNLVFATYLHPIGNVLTTINGHVFDRYCERYLHTSPKALETKELADVWTDIRQGAIHYDEITSEITTSTDYGLVFGKIDVKNKILTYKTFVNTIKLFPNQSLEKRKLREAENAMAERGMLGTMDIESGRMLPR